MQVAGRVIWYFGVQIPQPLSCANLINFSSRIHYRQRSQSWFFLLPIILLSSLPSSTDSHAKPFVCLTLSRVQGRQSLTLHSFSLLVSWNVTERTNVMLLLRIFAGRHDRFPLKV